MIQRCANESNPRYSDYGGRGISVCGRWRLFDAFLEDMGIPPENHTLDRKDNNGNYCKDNCVWSTTLSQARNTRANHVITYMGKSLCMQEWSEITGIDHRRISTRILRGWDPVRAITEPIGPQGGKEK